MVPQGCKWLKEKDFSLIRGIILRKDGGGGQKKGPGGPRGVLFFVEFIGNCNSFSNFYEFFAHVEYEIFDNFACYSGVCVRT